MQLLPVNNYVSAHLYNKYMVICFLQTSGFVPFLQNFGFFNIANRSQSGSVKLLKFQFIYACTALLEYESALCLGLA